MRFQINSNGFSRDRSFGHKLKGRLGYMDNRTSRVVLHTKPNSTGYIHPLMFKKEMPDMGDCPSCSNGFFLLKVKQRGVPYYEGEFISNYLSGHFS